MVIVHCTLYTNLTILNKNRVEIEVFWKPEISVGSLQVYLLKISVESRERATRTFIGKCTRFIV